MRKNAQIQMNSPLSSSRQMRNNLLQNSPQPLIQQQQSIQQKGTNINKHHEISKTKYNKNELRNVFDDDFTVQAMNNPQKYLPSYTMRHQDNDNCMTCFQTCCGEIFLACTMFAPLCCCKCCVYELGTSTAGLVEKFGKFQRLLLPGFNRINPCSEEVREVDMKITVLSTPYNIVITKDNVKLTIDTSVAFRITNPIIVYYKLGQQLNKAVSQLVISSCRKIIGQYTLDTVLNDRKILIRQIIQQIHSNLIQGIYIDNIFIDDIKIPIQIENSLCSVAKQRRVSQAIIINSKADVQCASLMKETAQLMDTKAAMQIRYLQLVQQLGKGGVSVLMDIGVDKQGFKLYQHDTERHKLESNQD